MRLRQCSVPVRSGVLVACAWLTLFFGVPSSRAAVGDTTTSQALIAQAIASFPNPACGAWHVSGICFWLKCSIFHCEVKTSTRYSHRQPDVVVSTYHDSAFHPWPQIGVPLAAAASGAGASILGGMFDSAGSMFKTGRTDMQRKWKDGDVIGHPAASMSLGGITCPGAATSYFPYYQSLLDSYTWRGILPVELLYPPAFIPGLREVGVTGVNTWGSVYPRNGELVQQHPVKNAAVLSQRIADFVTRSGQPHVYYKLKSGGMEERNNKLVWDPPPAQETIPMNVWQLSAPMIGAASTSCTPFGLPDLGPLSYGDYSTSGSMGYAFTLWRPYACCKVKGIFLFAIQWGMW